MFHSFNKHTHTTMKTFVAITTGMLALSTLGLARPTGSSIQPRVLEEQPALQLDARALGRKKGKDAAAKDAAPKAAAPPAAAPKAAAAPAPIPPITNAAVTNAASTFAGDVAIVSASLNGMGTTMDTGTVKGFASKAYVAEVDEDQHRAVLNKAATSGGANATAATAANAQIVQNTPIVLKALKNIMNDPSPANTMKNLDTMEKARYVPRV